MEIKLLNEYIIDPLMSVIDRTLTNVVYTFITNPGDVVEIEKPDLIGIFNILLDFQGKSINIYVDWQLELRSDNNRFHIKITRENGKSVAVGALDMISSYPALYTKLWGPSSGELLQKISVYGNNLTPQAVNFKFPSQSITISLGYGNEDAIACDGDDLLVFDDHLWNCSVFSSHENNSLIWSYPD